MATMASSSSLKFSHPFPSSMTQPLHHPKPTLSFIPKASSETDSTNPTTHESAPALAPDDFDDRLTRIKFRSGMGKKAEKRKAKKGKRISSSANGAGVFLPPVPLKEPVSGGLKVNLGLDPYAERLNGRLAGLGLAALLLVELGSGKSLIKYHTPSVVFLQVYFVAAISALYVKFEKEKVSVWPRDQ